MTILAQTDPTGLSSTAGKLVIVAMLAAALVVLIVQWRRFKDR
jgi:hypothetical protein